MPRPSYRPAGMLSASPTARSTSETWPNWLTSVRAIPSTRSGSSAIDWANSIVFGRISVERSMSRKGVGTCRLTTRIISSGVTPFAANAATNEPALVPTYTSNWLTVLLTASRSSARRAPISYTPPVKPPPPRTRAVRERLRRRCCGLRVVFLPFVAEGFSSLTTLSMRRRGQLSQPTQAIGCGFNLIWVRFAALALVLLVFPASAFGSLGSQLRRQMRASGSYSGALVVDASSGKTLFSWRAGTPRVLASNTKLFTTSAALARFGADGVFTTSVVADAPVGADGVIKGDLWLRGGGDPAFGTLAYVRRHYGPDAGSVEYLVDQLSQLGVTAVRGGVHGDESAFDAIRGVHDSGYYTSPWVGPLSALTLNHGYDSHGFQSNPASYAALVLRRTLKADDISPGHGAASSRAPSDATVLASVPSPPMAELARLTNKESDNFFAETLLKDLGRASGGIGSTAAGVRAVLNYGAKAGASPVALIDGSGLDHGDRASPRSVVRLLTYERARPEFQAFYDSLPIAGVDGTIYDRMRKGAAHRRCHAKTGSLSGVSALSGYCTTVSGKEITFSFLMNGISTTYARRLQDRMAQAIAGS